MKDETLDNRNTIKKEKTHLLVSLLQSVPRLLVPMFAMFFLLFALLYASSAFIEFLKPILIDGDLTSGLFKGLHMGVVALAVYELAQVVHQEYDTSGKPSDAAFAGLYSARHRTLLTPPPADRPFPAVRW